MTPVPAPTRPLPLFIVACGLAGLGAALGSMVGHFGGRTALFTGGVLGGLLGAVGSAVVARTRHWIAPGEFMGTAIGACAGFLAAAVIATHTLSGPVGPVLSTLLIGAGALLGARFGLPGRRSGSE